MSRTVLPILALSAALLAAPAGSEEMMDPLALIRKTLKYWHRIYETYREEVALGYCWADYLLGIEESISGLPAHRDIMGDPLNSTGRGFGEFRAAGARGGSSDSIRFDGETLPGRDAAARNGVRYRRSYRQPGDYRDAERFLSRWRAGGNYAGEAVDPGRAEGLLNLVDAGLQGIRGVFNIQEEGVDPGGDRRPGANSSDAIVSSGVADKPGAGHGDKFFSNESSGTGPPVEKNAERADHSGFLKPENYPEEAFRKSADGITTRRVLCVKNDPPGDTSSSSSSELSPEKHRPYDEPLSRRKDTGALRTLSGPKFEGNRAEDDREVRAGSRDLEEGTRRKLLYSMTNPAADRSFEGRTFSLELSDPDCQESLDNRRFSDRADARPNDHPSIEDQGIKGNRQAGDLILNYETTDAPVTFPHKSGNREGTREKGWRRKREAKAISEDYPNIGSVDVTTGRGNAESQSNLNQPLINESLSNRGPLNSAHRETELWTNYKEQLADSGRSQESVGEVNLEVERSSKLLKMLLNLTNQDKELWADYETKPQLDVPGRVGRDKTKAGPGTKESLKRFKATLNFVIKNPQDSDAEKQSTAFHREQERATSEKQLFSPFQPLNNFPTDGVKMEKLNEKQPESFGPKEIKRDGTEPKASDRSAGSGSSPGTKFSKSESFWKPSEPPFRSGYPTIERWADYKAKTQYNPPTTRETRDPADSRVSLAPKHLPPFAPVNNRRRVPTSRGSSGRRLFLRKSRGVVIGEEEEEGEDKEEEEGKKDRSPGGGSSLPGVRKRRFMADYRGSPDGASRNPRRSRSSGTRDQGRRSSSIVPEARGPGQTLAPLLDLRAGFMTVLRMFGLFIHVGRQIMSFIEANKLLACTWDYLWMRLLEWIDS